MRHSKIIAVDQLITLGSKRYYFGPAPFPGTPAIGDRWDEVDGSNNLIQDWFWNGSFWLSTQEYAISVDVNNSTINAAVALPLDTTANIFLLDIQAGLLSTVASSGTNFVSWAITRITAANAPTTIASANTSTIVQTANTWARYKNAINTHFSVSATGAIVMRIALTRTGNPGNVSGTFLTRYRLARL